MASKQPPMASEVQHKLVFKLSDLNYPAAMLFWTVDATISRSLWHCLWPIDLRARTSPQVKMDRLLCSNWTKVLEVVSEHMISAFWSLSTHFKWAVWPGARTYDRGRNVLLRLGAILKWCLGGGGRGLPKCRRSKGGCVILVLRICSECRQERGSKIPKIV